MAASLAKYNPIMADRHDNRNAAKKLLEKMRIKEEKLKSAGKLTKFETKNGYMLTNHPDDFECDEDFVILNRD